MIEREKQPLADSSLELARELRKAERRRQETIRPAVEAYDAATEEQGRWGAAAEFMEALRAADDDFAAARARAAASFARREARLTGAGEQ